ncbi:MAG: hypothetical protein ACK46W_00380, partial [Bacteroidota bacterium]
GFDKEEYFLIISKKIRIEIEKKATAEQFRNKISGFIDKKQFSLFLEDEKPNNEIKVALGFCRPKAVKSLRNYKTFYFHAIKDDKSVKDFPSGIYDAKRLIIYSCENDEPNSLTGHFAEIESIELKHKAKIKGKENSKIEFYYEIKLQDYFEESEDLKFAFNPKKLFDKSDDKNIKLFQQFLPALTTWDKLIKSLDTADAIAS